MRAVRFRRLPSRDAIEALYRSDLLFDVFDEAERLNALANEAEALATAYEIHGEMDNYLDRVGSAGDVQVATHLRNRAADAIEDYEPEVGDPSLPARVAALQERAADLRKGKQ